MMPAEAKINMGDPLRKTGIWGLAFLRFYMRGGRQDGESRYLKTNCSWKRLC